jgi:hypothetical protein
MPNRPYLYRKPREGELLHPSQSVQEVKEALEKGRDAPKTTTYVQTGGDYARAVQEKLKQTAKPYLQRIKK